MKFNFQIGFLKTNWTLRWEKLWYVICHFNFLIILQQDKYSKPLASLLLLQVKPARAGSSIGVTVAYGVVDSFSKAKEIISEV